MNNTLEYILSLKDQFTRTMGQAGNAAQEFAGKEEVAEASTRSLEGSMESLGSSFKSMFASFGLAFGGFKAFEFGAESIDKALDIEKFETAYETLLKSKEAARGLVEELSKSKTAIVFGNENTLGAGQTLLNAGVGAEKLKRVMGELGNISKGSGQDMNEMAQAYSVAAQRGYVEARRILQIPGALQEFGKMTGMHGKELSKFMAEGQIGIKQLDEVLQRMTSSGGKYFGALNLFLDSNAGKIAREKHNVDLLQESIGEKLIPVKMKWLEVEENLISKGGDLLTWMEKHKEMVKVTGEAILIFAGTYLTLTSATQLFTAAQLALSAGLAINPFFLAAAAVAALALSYKNLADSQAALDAKNEEIRKGGETNELAELKEWAATYKGVLSDKAKAAKLDEEQKITWDNLTKAERAYAKNPNLNTLAFKQAAQNAYAVVEDADPKTFWKDLLKGGTGKKGKDKSVIGGDADVTSSAIEGITGGGVRNMTINVQRFWNDVIVEGGTPKDIGKQIGDHTIKAVLRVLNSANQVQLGT